VIAVSVHSREGNQPVKTEWWGAGVVVCLEQGANLVLPFWYHLTWVVPEKGLLNGCTCVEWVIDEL